MSENRTEASSDFIVRSIPASAPGFPQGTRELRITFSEYKGSHGVSLRIWEKVNGKMFPTKKGVWIRQEVYREVVEALTQAEDLFTW
jgi:hypothetical protein